MTTRTLLQDHQELRRRAASSILRLAEFADEEQGQVTHQGRTIPRHELLREIAHKLSDNTFVLAVVGEFSRGKSSLINALLDQPSLLPTAMEPSTAAITVLSYAPEMTISVTLADGTVRNGLTREEFASYALGKDLDDRSRRRAIARKVAEFEARAGMATLLPTDFDMALDEEPPAPDSVKEIHVGVPSPFLRDGICLVDTPGIGSVNPAHGEATRAFIHRADAVLFLVNTDPVIGQSECNFLAFLKDYVQRFLFLVTKVDRFSPRERQESVAYTRRTIEEHAGIPSPPIYPVSARMATLGRSEPDEMKYRLSGFPEFLEGLQGFLVNARGKEFLSRHVHLAQVQLQDLINASLMELQSLKMCLEEIPAHMEATAASLRQADLRRRQVLEALASRRYRVEAVMEAFSPTALVRLDMLLTSEIERLVDGYDWDQLQRVSETIPVFLRDLLSTRLGPDFAAVARQMTRLREDILAACRDYFGEMSAELGRRFKGLRLPDRLTVSLDFDPNELSNRLQRIGTYTIGYTFALTLAGIFAVGPLGALVLLGGLVARQTMTASLRNEVKRRLKQSLSPALARLLSDLFRNVREDVDRSLTQFQNEIQGYLHSATAGLETKLEEMRRMTPVSEPQSQLRQQRLRVRLAELEQIHAELSLLIEPDW